MKKIYLLLSLMLLPLVASAQVNIGGIFYELNSESKTAIVTTSDREAGGSKFENEYVCSMLGSLAGCRFYEGDVVAATLRFSTHEYQGQAFQEILVTDIVKL